MAPKEETSQEGSATDGVIQKSKMVDVSTQQENISITGKRCSKTINPATINNGNITEFHELNNSINNDVHEILSNDSDCGKKIPQNPHQNERTDHENNEKEKSEYLINQHCAENIESEENSKTSSYKASESSDKCVNSEDYFKDGSVSMSLCVTVAEGTALPPELWQAAIHKEPVNVWILQVADNELCSDSKIIPSLQVIFPLDQTWSWSSPSDIVSSDDDEPPTYTTLQTVSWDDSASCHSGYLQDMGTEGAGSSSFSDDEEMSSVTGDNFYMLGSESGLPTSSSDGDLRMLLQAGIGSPDHPWSEDVNTFALAELRLGSDADSRCSIDTERQPESLPPAPAPSPKESFRCPLCHKTFMDQLNFKYHKRTHKDRKLFTCDCCNQKFAREKTLERHRLTHSVSVQPVVLKCPTCDESFDKRAQLRVHLRTVHRDNPVETSDLQGTLHTPSFSCEICRKTFAHETRLKHHQAAHYERQYKCHICTVTLATKHSLRRHLYIHSGQKPYCCEKCGKSFAFELYLRNHMKKHLTYKLHDCAFCPERFCSRRELKIHVRVHRGQYRCQVCEEVFRSKHKYKEHVRVHEA